jgi:putative transcriptional regulator
VFVLRPALDGPRLRTIDATHALALRGMTMLRAKRATETLLENGRVFVDLPTVEDVQVLIAELAAAGIAAAHIQPDPTVNVRELRERLQLTREQFAIRYGLEVETLRNWETGKREPDTTARSYLRAIANAPEQLELAYAHTAPNYPPAC